MCLIGCFEREFHAHVVSRSGLLYDSKFGVPTIRRSDAHLYLFPRGHVTLDGTTHLAPSAFIASSNEIEAGKDATSRVRTWGKPLQLVDLRFRHEHVLAPVGVEHGMRTLSEATWAAARRLVDCAESPGGAVGVESTVGEMLAALEHDGVLSAVPRASIRNVEDTRFRRLNSAVAPSFASVEVSLSAKKLFDLIGVSRRQLSRDTTDLTETFGMIGLGYRDVMRRLRLRTAVLFLSTERATVTEVAYKMGYSDTHAMARAFRDANLPTPMAVQQAVQAEH